MLDALLQRRDALNAQIDHLIAVPLPSERRAAEAANAEVQALLDERDQLEQRIRTAQDHETRRGAEAEAHRRLGIGDTDRAGQPRLGRGADTVYARGNGYSYFRDLITFSTPGDPGQMAAMQRLNEHAQVVERAAPDLPYEFRATEEKGAAHSFKEQRVNPNRTDGQGGNFVPPLWIIDEYVALLRAGRSIVDRCNVRPLPGGTDNVMLPKVATGTTTAVQTADAVGVSSTDLTDASLSGPVRTIAGQQDISQQLFDQSPINFDEVVFADLIADYNQKFDVQVLTGTNAAGQVAGILPMAGINAVTYTDATPTLPELWVPLTQSMSQVAKNRFMPPDTIGMTPSMWYWMMSQLDTAGRPILAPQGGNGQNTLAVYDANAVEGVAGALGNVPIVLDANIPTNLGAGTNETRIITGRLKDLWVYEGALRTRALVEVLSGTLQVRLQVFNYIATIPNRYPTAVSVISGTGLIPVAGW